MTTTQPQHVIDIEAAIRRTLLECMPRLRAKYGIEPWELLAGIGAALLRLAADFVVAANDGDGHESISLQVGLEALARAYCVGKADCGKD